MKQRRLLFRRDKGLDQESDEFLIERYKHKKEQTYLAELYKRYLALVFGVCYKYLKDKKEAEDAVSSIFEKLIEDVKTTEIRNFRSWLYKTTQNYCLGALRKSSSSKNVSASIEELEKIMEIDVEKDQSLHHNIEGEERLKLLENALEQLGDEQKSCITLFYLKKKSYKEVAENLGISVNEVKSHIQNGRRNLKLKLEPING